MVFFNRFLAAAVLVLMVIIVVMGVIGLATSVYDAATYSDVYDAALGQCVRSGALYFRYEDVLYTCADFVGGGK